MDVWLAKGSEELLKDLFDSSENGEAVVFSSVEAAAAFSSLVAIDTFFVASVPSEVSIESFAILSSCQEQDNNIVVTSSNKFPEKNKLPMEP